MIKRKLAYLGLLAIFWLVMHLYLFPATAILFYMLLVFLPILFLVFCVGTFRMKVVVEIPVQVVKKGELFCLRFRVKGRQLLPAGAVVVWLLHRNCATGKWKKKKLVFSPDGEDGYELYAESEYCAQFAFSVKKAKIYDMFQIFSKKIPVVECGIFEGGVTVLPEAYAMEGRPVKPNPNVMVEGELYSGVKGGDDASELFDIRTYNPGDKLNRIHWKLTGKFGQIMVKEFGLPVDCSVLIFLDYGFHKDMAEFLKYRDALLCALFSLSGTLSAQGQVHYIAWNAPGGQNEKHKISAPEAFYETVGLLLREAAGRKPVNGTARFLAEYGENQYSNIFYLSADKAPGEGLLLMEQARKSAWLSALLFCEREAMQEVGECLPADVEILYFDTDEIKEELGSAFFAGGNYTWQGN